MLINFLNVRLLNYSSVLLLTKYLLGAHSKPDPLSDTRDKILSTAHGTLAPRKLRVSSDRRALNEPSVKKCRMTNCLSVCINTFKDEKKKPTVFYWNKGKQDSGYETEKELVPI